MSGRCRHYPDRICPRCKALPPAADNVPATRHRAGDRERDATINVLTWAHANGYLGVEESAAREQAARHAQTLSSLEALIEDFPEPPEEVSLAVWLRDMWAIGRDNPGTWISLAAGGAWLVVSPVAMIVTFPGGIGWWKALMIATSMVAGVLIFVLSVIGAVNAQERIDKENRGR